MLKRHEVEILLKADQLIGGKDHLSAGGARDRCTQGCAGRCD
jgi:hypothetical protein